MGDLNFSVEAAKDSGLIEAATAVLGNLAVAAAALGGAWLTLFMSDRHRKEDAMERKNAEEMRRNSERLVLALHLEKFAKACAEVVAHNGDPEMEDERPHPIPQFPKWPAISWILLGAKVTAQAMDVQARVELRRDNVFGDIRYNATDQHDVGKFHSKGAAIIGLEAWRVAESLRKEAGVEPFEFVEDGWNYAETLRIEAQS